MSRATRAGQGFSARNVAASGLLAVALAMPLFAALSTAGAAESAVETSPGGRKVQLRAEDRVRMDRVPARPEASRPRAPGAVQIRVNYDAGFDANPQAKAAFQRALDIWSAILTSPVEVTVNAKFSALEPGVLGQAGPNSFSRNFTNAPQSNTWYPAAVANKLAGTDLNPTAVDFEAEFSSTFGFYLGVDGNPPPNQYDFVTVVMHELAHGLGFLGSLRPNQANQGVWGLGTPVNPLIYDRFTENGAGQRLIDVTVFPNPSLALATQLTSNNLYFNSPAANAANGGQRVKLYAPNPFNGGSSYSHLDDDTFDGTPNALLTHAAARGEAIHDPGAIGRAMFQDLGWTVGGGGGGGQANLTVQKQAPGQVAVNDNLTYTITVQNTGGATATGVTLNDPLPGGLTPIQAPTTNVGTCTNAATVTCSLGDLAPNATATITIVVRPTQAGNLTNTVTVNPGNKQAQAATTVTGGGGGGGGGGSSMRLVMTAPIYNDPGNTMVFCYTFQGTGISGWFLLDTDGTFAYTSLGSSFKAKKGLVTAKDNAGIFLDFGTTEGFVKSKMNSKMLLGGRGTMQVNDKIFGKSFMTAAVQSLPNSQPCVVPALEGASPAELLAWLGPINLDNQAALDGEPPRASIERERRN